MATDDDDDEDDDEFLINSCFCFLYVRSFDRRVHITKTTLDHLGDKFEVEPGNGQQREVRYARAAALCCFLSNFMNNSDFLYMFMVTFVVSVFLFARHSFLTTKLKLISLYRLK